ncbi:hypothetical protein AB0J63_25545 [Streptosporangium canum]|uniref:hypothetical protein n=1 Tax=Streptosporangium canum TaxID=324952 RepID=UPI003436FA3D
MSDEYGLTRPRTELRPEVDGFLQIECRHLLTGHTQRVDQPIGEPVRNRLPHRWLVDVEVFGQGSQTVDDLTETDDIGARTTHRPNPRPGFGISKSH